MLTKLAAWWLRRNGWFCGLNADKSGGYMRVCGGAKINEIVTTRPITIELEGVTTIHVLDQLPAEVYSPPDWKAVRKLPTVVGLTCTEYAPASPFAPKTPRRTK